MSKNLERSHWLKEASCVGEDTKLFTSFDPEKVEQAKSICKTCPVKMECLVFQGDTAYIAGGFTRYERLKKSWRRVSSTDEGNWDELD